MHIRNPSDFPARDRQSRRIELILLSVSILTILNTIAILTLLFHRMRP